MTSEEEQLYCFYLCFAFSFGASFTDQGDEVGNPVVVLAHLVDCCIIKDPAGENGTTGQGEEVKDMFLVAVTVFRVSKKRGVVRRGVSVLRGVWRRVFSEGR